MVIQQDQDLLTGIHNLLDRWGAKWMVQGALDLCDWIRAGWNRVRPEHSYQIRLRDLEGELLLSKWKRIGECHDANG